MSSFSLRNLDPNPLLENPLLEKVEQKQLLEKVVQNNNKNGDC